MMTKIKAEEEADRALSPIPDHHHHFLLLFLLVHHHHRHLTHVPRTVTVAARIESSCAAALCDRAETCLALLSSAAQYVRVRAALYGSVKSPRSPSSHICTGTGLTAAASAPGLG
jgi:hypothetical protein